MATDLFGRGMDIERVNIVFNYDMPESSDTYLHRVSGGHMCSLSVFLKSLICLSILMYIFQEIPVMYSVVLEKYHGFL